MIYYEKYANKESSFSTSNVAASSGSKLTRAQEYMARKKQKGVAFVNDSNILGELNKYKEIEWDSRFTAEKIDNLNILTSWKEHARAFLVLSIMARDLLTPSTSTVASESAFSIGGKVLEGKKE